MNPRDTPPRRFGGHSDRIRWLIALGWCASLFAGAATFSSPGVSAAAGNQCATSARIVARTGSGFIMWNGKETGGVASRFTGAVLTAGQHFYELHGQAVKITFGGDTYSLGGNAVFDLGCSGLAAGQPAVMPRIALLVGSATVNTTHVVEGSVSTEESLLGQAPHSAATSYTVVRQLSQHSPLTLSEKIIWYESLANQPAGVTNVKTLTGVLANVTPYVGPGPGHCRQVHSARLVTTSSFGHGTAEYHF